MAQKVCRVGDTGTGYCEFHRTEVTVTLVQGCTHSRVEGSEICTIDSIGIASCGHSTIATTGSNIFRAEGKGVHRVGDVGIIAGGGNYVMVTGADHVVAD